MTNEEALMRAKRALRDAHEESNAFDSGGMASHEIMALIRRFLEAEFSKHDAS